jgi:signal transduction histidine kinase
VEDAALVQAPWRPDRPVRRDSRATPPDFSWPSRRDNWGRWDYSRRHADSPGPRRRGPHSGWPGGAVLVAALFQVFGARSAAGDGDVLRPMDLLAYALLLVGPIALFWRRRFPITVLAVASAASIGFATFAAPRWVFAVAPVIALFTAVRAGRRGAAIVAAGAGYVAYLMICWVFAPELGVPGRAQPDLRTAVLLAAGLGLTVVLGGAAKVRAEHFAELMKVRAERARAHEEQERRQASEERLRIARELHDVLGHHLSLINVQAGVGLHLMDNRPEQAREALSAIKTASAEALREVRAVLGVLRPEEEAAPRQPALGLDRLGELTADAGLQVTTTVSGERRALPAEVDRAAYRIVQEALTNVRRHAAGGSAAEITIEYGRESLRISIRDDGSGAAAVAADSGGSGIAGMRARAESLGGTLEAGPLPDGGFQVSATLPAARSATSANDTDAAAAADPASASVRESGTQPRVAAEQENA